MQRRPKTLSSWIRDCTIAAACLGLVLFYGIGHILRRIPLEKLWGLYGVILVLTLLLAPSMHWATKRNRRGDPNVKRIACVVDIYLWSVSVVYLRYGVLLGAIALKDVAPILIIITLMVFISFVSSYYGSKKLSTNTDSEPTGLDSAKQP